MPCTHFDAVLERAVCFSEDQHQHQQKQVAASLQAVMAAGAAVAARVLEDVAATDTRHIQARAALQQVKQQASQGQSVAEAAAFMSSCGLLQVLKASAGDLLMTN